MFEEIAHPLSNQHRPPLMICRYRLAAPARARQVRARAASARASTNGWATETVMMERQALLS